MVVMNQLMVYFSHIFVIIPHVSSDVHFRCLNEGKKNLKQNVSSEVANMWNDLFVTFTNFNDLFHHFIIKVPLLFVVVVVVVVAYSFGFYIFSC